MPDHIGIEASVSGTESQPMLLIRHTTMAPISRLYRSLLLCLPSQTMLQTLRFGLQLKVLWIFRSFGNPLIGHDRTVYRHNCSLLIHQTSCPSQDPISCCARLLPKLNLPTYTWFHIVRLKTVQ